MVRHWQSPDLDTGDAPFCHAVLDDRYAFLAGQVAADLPGGAAAIGDIRAETDLVMRSIRSLLGRLGLGMESIVRVDVHMTDLTRMAAMNEVYRGFFEAGKYPARTCTEAGRLAGGCTVEITCVAKI